MSALQLVRPPLMTRGQIARSTKLTPRAIRYYQRAGLVREAPRTGGNYRPYDGEALEQLRFIAQWRGLGFTLKEIGALCTILNRGSQTCAQLEALVSSTQEFVSSSGSNQSWPASFRNAQAKTRPNASLSSCFGSRRRTHGE